MNDLIDRQVAIDATCADCGYDYCRYRDSGIEHAKCNYVDRLKRLLSVIPSQSGSMTKEEVIEELENAVGLIKQDGKDWFDERDIPLLKSIIEILKAEPCEDCIDREALMDIEYEDVIDVHGKQYVRLMEVADKTIKMPTVRPKEYVGHWIMTSDYLTTAYGSVDYVKCSCCGEDSLEEGDYCPNCGAKMQETESER